MTRYASTAAGTPKREEAKNMSWGIGSRRRALLGAGVGVLTFVLTPFSQPTPEGGSQVSLALGLPAAQAQNWENLLSTALKQVLKNVKFRVAGTEVSVGKLVGPVISAVRAFIERKFVDGIIKIVDTAQEVLPSAVRKYIEAFKGALATLLDGLIHKGLKVDWGKLLGELAEGVYRIVRDKIPEKVQTFVKKIPDLLKRVFTAIFTKPSVGSIVTAVVESVPDFLPSVARKWIQPFLPAVLKVSEKLDNLSKINLGEIIAEVVKGVGSLVKKLAGEGSRFGKIVEPTAEIVANIFASWPPNLPGILKAVVGGAKAFLKEARLDKIQVGPERSLNIGPLADALVETVTGFLGGKMPDWSKVLSSLFESIEKLIPPPKDPNQKSVGSYVKPILGVVGKVLTAVVGKKSPPWEAIIPDVLKAIVDFLPSKTVLGSEVKIRETVEALGPTLARVLSGGKLDWKALILDLMNAMKNLVPTRIGTVKTEPIVTAVVPIVAEILKGGTPDWALVLQRVFEGVKGFLPTRYQEVVAKLGPIVARLVGPLMKGARPDWAGVLSLGAEAVQSTLLNENVKALVGAGASFLASLIGSSKVDMQKLVPVLGTLLTALKPLVGNARVKQGIDLIVSMAGTGVPASGSSAPEQPSGGAQEEPAPDAEPEGGAQ
jgi:hypothetical protein